jgi:hypothetical protein
VNPMVTLSLMLAASAVSAENWITPRAPLETAKGLPGMLVNLASIKIHDENVRRAKVKSDFSSCKENGASIEYAGRSVDFLTRDASYDCNGRSLRTESIETHVNDGSVAFKDLANTPGWKWGPAPGTRTADPTVDFVCT